jgi:hypothetical protein
LARGLPRHAIPDIRSPPSKWLTGQGACESANTHLDGTWAVHGIFGAAVSKTSVFNSLALGIGGRNPAQAFGPSGG